MRRALAALAAAALAAGMLALGGGAPAQAASCSYGAIGTSWNPGPPGKAHVWLGTPDTPTACGMVRAEAWAQNGPHPVFGKWNKNVGYVSTAAIPNYWPNPRLLRASEWKEHVDGTGCMKRRFYPTLGSWVSCGTAPVKTLALALPQANGCVGTSECLFYQGKLSGPGYFESEWITNAHFHFERGVAKCGNGTRYTILNKGGWVTALDTFSRANCTKSYPNLVGAAFDIKTCSTCSFTRHWVTTINVPARRALAAR